MGKISKILLVALMTIGLLGCQSKTKLADTLEEKGYTIQRQEQFKTIQRSVNLISSDEKTVIIGQFKLDKSLIGIGYGENGKYYYSDELVAMGLKSDDSLKTNFDNWLKEMNVDEQEVKDYLTEINNKTREPIDIQSNIEKANFEAEFKTDVPSQYDDDLYFVSESKKIFMDAFIKDKKVVRFVFANETFGADKLFVYTNDKVFKDDGTVPYILFLYDLNITHEEFMAYIENIYQRNIS